MIRQVSRDAIVIGDRSYGETIALTPDGILEDFVAPPLDNLAESHFDSLFSREPELILLGTGMAIIFPKRELTFSFARRGIGLEVMDTAAAARTFNVLAGEGRRLAAVLYL